MDLRWAGGGVQIKPRGRRDIGRSADGTGDVERLTTGSTTAVPFALSRDGVLVFDETSSETRDDLHALTMNAWSPPAPLLQTQFDEEARLPS